MELILIRHTKVAIENGTCYGQSDISVAETFIKEKDLIINNLNTSNAKIISSPLKRCTKLAKYLSVDYRTDKRIQELNFGNWEMQKWDEIKDLELDIWMNNYLEYPCPNGESLLDMKKRVSDFYEDVKKQNSQKIIIVTHGGIIRLFYHLIDQIDLKEMFDIKVDFGSIHSFKIPV